MKLLCTSRAGWSDDRSRRRPHERYPRTFAREPDPTFTGADVASPVDGVGLTNVQDGILRETLQASVDLARYWQEPDGTDAVAALPDLQDALRRVARHLSPSAHDLETARGPAQYAVALSSLAESAPLARRPRGASRGMDARAARGRVEIGPAPDATAT
jgi:hypothetical protein